jgi:hypothetical protein
MNYRTSGRSRRRCVALSPNSRIHHNSNLQADPYAIGKSGCGMLGWQITVAQNAFARLRREVCREQLHWF